MKIYEMSLYSVSPKNCLVIGCFFLMADFGNFVGHLGALNFGLDIKVAQNALKHFDLGIFEIRKKTVSVHK